MRFVDPAMARGKITRRQKDVSRLLREKKKIRQDRLKKFSRETLSRKSPGK